MNTISRTMAAFCLVFLTACGIEGLSVDPKLEVFVQTVHSAPMDGSGVYTETPISYSFQLSKLELVPADAGGELVEFDWTDTIKIIDRPLKVKSIDAKDLEGRSFSSVRFTIDEAWSIASKRGDSNLVFDSPVVVYDTPFTVGKGQSLKIELHFLWRHTISSEGDVISAVSPDPRVVVSTYR